MTWYCKPLCVSFTFYSQLTALLRRTKNIGSAQDQQWKVWFDHGGSTICESVYKTSKTVAMDNMLREFGLPHLKECVNVESRFAVPSGSTRAFKPICDYCRKDPDSTT